MSEERYRIRWTHLLDADKWEADNDVVCTAETPEIAKEIERRWNGYADLQAQLAEANDRIALLEICEQHCEENKKNEKRVAELEGEIKKLREALK